MHHRVNHRVGVLESFPARGHEVLVGHLDVLSVEDLLALVIEFLPNVRTSFYLQDVGSLAEITRLDDTDLKEKKSELVCI